MQTRGTAVAGVDLALEMPSWHRYPWQQYLANPTLGVGISVLDLGHRALGQMIATYPYLAFNIVNTKVFDLKIKTATGLSFFTETYYSTNTDPLHFYSEDANTAIGSVVNVYLAASIDMTFNVAGHWAINAAADYRHASNGSTIQPNGGLNLITGSLGLTYNIAPENGGKHEPLFARIPNHWGMRVSLSGGTRQLFYLDKHRNHPIGSFHIGATYSIGSWYAIGLATDLFYDGAFNRQGITLDMSDNEKQEQRQYTSFNRYLITDNSFANKLRLGLAITNEMHIGRVTMLLDWGVYLFNPLRNKMVAPHPKYGNKRPLFYSYDIDTDDGWNYFRLGIRCRIVDNIYLQASVKTHLQKAEMLEWGIGYQIP